MGGGALYAPPPPFTQNIFLQSIYLKILDLTRLVIGDVPTKKNLKFSLTPSQSSLKYGPEYRPRPKLLKRQLC